MLPPLPSPSPPLSPSINLISSACTQKTFLINLEPFFSATDDNLVYLGAQYEKFLKLVPHVEPGKHLVSGIIFNSIVVNYVTGARRRH